jgi:hypothetical protein
MKKLGIAIMTLGVLLLAGYGIFHFMGDAVVSEIRKNTDSTIVQVPAPASASSETSEASSPDNAPPATVDVRQYTIRVTNEGGEEAMDACSGGFTRMLGYEGLEEKEMLSAHNNCGGDVILPIEVGDRVVIEGQGTYTVQETRDTGKTIYTDAVVDMNGSILVQTCYYQDQTMKFLALAPVEAASA